MKLQEVTYQSDYTIQVKFTDGVVGSVDLTDLVEKGIFQVLKDKEKFSKPYSTGYAIAWSEELEIDAATVYAEIDGKLGIGKKARTIK
jgi:Protein of unknown function (DUF2442)